MRIEVIGGGPGGMYAARLLKLRQPTWHVRVRERNSSEGTFGFGIGLSPKTLGRMKEADRDTYDGLVEIGFPLDTWRMRNGAREIRGGDNQSIGLERASLLQVLASHAEKAGVDVVWNCLTALADVRDADLVVAADGAGSGTRAELATELGVSVEHGDLAYIWCGADLKLSSMQFEVVPTDHGTFVAHVMPYAPARCTFQVDTVLSTIRRAGLDDDQTDSDGNDPQTLEYLSSVFSDVLDGTKLHGNRSVWSTFGTVRCDRWSHDNVVLIGDAAHTAHYSVGSGTRMAMEDALALVSAVVDSDDIPAALKAYEQRRRPSADRLQRRAIRSQQWWTDFPRRTDLPMSQLMVNYQTRTGAFGAAGLRDTDPALVEAATAELAGTSPAEHEGGVAGIPLTLASTTLPGRVVHEDDGAPVTVVDPAHLAEHARATKAVLAVLNESGPEVAIRAMEAGADGVVMDVTGPGDLLEALDAAERVRLDTGAVVAVRGHEGDLDQLEAAVLAGRVDLVLVAQTVEVSA